MKIPEARFGQSYQTRMSPGRIENMAHRTNPFSTYLLEGPDHNRPVVIEPQLAKSNAGSWTSTGVYKIYKDYFDDRNELSLLPDPEGQLKLSDDLNPDYLGTITITGKDWRYEGSQLNQAEQHELVSVIIDDEEPEVD